MNKLEELELKIQEHIGQKYVVFCEAEPACSTLTGLPIVQITLFIYKGEKLVYGDFIRIHPHSLRKLDFDLMEERAYEWYEGIGTNYFIILLKLLLFAVIFIISCLIMLIATLALKAIYGIAWWISVPVIGFLSINYWQKIFELLFKK